MTYYKMVHCPQISKLVHFCKYFLKTYSEPSQISKMKLFVKIDDGFQPLIISAKRSWGIFAVFVKKRFWVPLFQLTAKACLINCVVVILDPRQILKTRQKFNVSCQSKTTQSTRLSAHQIFFFLSGFSLTTIHESQDSKGRGRAFL